MKDRRQFLQSMAGLTLAGSLASCTTPEEAQINPTSQENESQRSLNFGVGLFTIPFMLQDDFAGGIKKLADIGYKEVEVFGPYSYSVQQAHDYWNPIGDRWGSKRPDISVIHLEK